MPKVKDLSNAKTTVAIPTVLLNRLKLKAAELSETSGKKIKPANMVVEAVMEIWFAGEDLPGMAAEAEQDALAEQEQLTMLPDPADAAAAEPDESIVEVANKDAEFGALLEAAMSDPSEPSAQLSGMIQGSYALVRRQELADYLRTVMGTGQTTICNLDELIVDYCG